MTVKIVSWQTILNRRSTSSTSSNWCNKLSDMQTIFYFAFRADECKWVLSASLFNSIENHFAFITQILSLVDIEHY